MTGEAPPVLPASFYEQRSHLRQIRAAALARTTSPDAVLHATLARLAAFSPSDLLLPAFVGGEVPLNYFVAMVAPSGVGKSTSFRSAQGLLPPPDHLLDRDNVPVGSGEGLIESFFERDPDTGDKVQMHRNLFLYVDEGETFARLGQRDGTTLDTVIRSAFSGSLLGQRNAQRSTTRILPPNSYSIGMTVGYQPEKAGALLAQQAGGTPQRFVWAYAGLQGVNREDVLAGEWPGPLKVRGYDSRTGVIQFPEDIRTSIIEDHWRVASGEKIRPPLDSHQPVHLMRIAALLALMEGRIRVENADWELARQVWQTSQRVRRWVQLEVRAARDDEERERLTRAHSTAIAQAAGRTEAATLADHVRARVLSEITKAGEDGVAPSHIQRALTPKQAPFIDRALKDLARAGLIDRHPTKQRFIPMPADIIVVDD